MVWAHVDLDPDPDHAVTVDLAAFGAELLCRRADRGIVRVRGEADAADAPIPHPDGHRDHGDAGDEVQRLPSGGVQEEALVDGEV